MWRALKIYDGRKQGKAMSHEEEMKEMIQREIRSIENLEERVIFKELMEQVFLSLYETNEEMYQRLERRVMDELAYDINRYRIRTGLVERTYFDPSHHSMSAVCEEDLAVCSYRISDLRERIKEDGRVRLSTLFVQCDAMKVKEFFESQDTFTSLLKAGGEYPVGVRLEPGKRYLDQIEHLYHLFMKNGIPWKTINAPYLFKMADVFLTKLPEEIPAEEAVTGLGMDFGKFNPYVRYDRIPLWNIRRLKLDSTGFPIACGDYENYEHTISVREYGREHAYLVEDKRGVRKVRQSGDKLKVTGKAEKAQKWDVYMIRNCEDQKIDQYTYPVMENFRTDGFAERFERRSGQPVKTKGELERFIRGFGLEEFIEYQDCSLAEPNEERQETYSMNFFMRDEVREQRRKRMLTLYFKAKGREEWLHRDLASFVSSEVQELYPEYQCGGKFL